MSLPTHYNPQEAEPRWMQKWQEAGVYHFSAEVPGPVYSIDTPPATVSGNLHLGHVYSYSHPDFMARFWRMRGYNVYYPMGYDDNGLATERLVERSLGIRARQVGRASFIDACLKVSEQAEKEYQALWKRLGLSIDWRYTYRTIDEDARRISQLSFIHLYRKGLAYRQEAPVMWCPECHTAIAQAELEDLERLSEYITLPFYFADLAESSSKASFLPIATTRPELLPACVAVFVHPLDDRYNRLVGRRVQVPYFGQSVPVLADQGVDPHKGTGAVMCCTFGDTADIAWWRTHRLPLVEAIDRDGRMTGVAGRLAGLSLEQARQQIKGLLQEAGLDLGRTSAEQSVRVHERCDTPVEYIVTKQWFIRLLDFKEELLKAGERVRWHPESMQARYRAWVENLNWDWCISRQRYYGVPFPLWYCEACGEIVLAKEDQLPVEPISQQPGQSCSCGNATFFPEEDVLDTWATSSMTPQIAGQWLKNNNQEKRLYDRVFPFSLRPQAHEIIRTWTFYTIVKSYLHFGTLPWTDVLISGWGIAGEGMGKISKSRGGGPMPPLEMIERYSADAVRYWSSSTSPGKDAVISEEKISMGVRLVTKLWNVARFCARFLVGDSPVDQTRGRSNIPESMDNEYLSPADRWILSRLQRLVQRITQFMEGYDYAAAKSEVETFFWGELADNYLEMCKQRLYESEGKDREAARFTLRLLLLTILKLFAPFLPFVTEEIYQELYAKEEALSGNQRGIKGSFQSIHLTDWPVPDPELMSEEAERLGEMLVEIATAVRRYKSEHNLPLGWQLDRVQLAVGEPRLADRLTQARADLMSITRARNIEFITLEDSPIKSGINGKISISIQE